VVEYWRASLLDATAGATVPRQLALLDWLRERFPAGADDEPAVCMGDARLVNGLIAGTEVRALVDFEVAYVGHPAADIGYSLFFDDRQRRSAPQPLPGIPTADETWARWSRATGRDARDRDYWMAFGAMVLCVTATRAMLQWGLADATVETDNPLVTAWEHAVQRAITSSTITRP
jgi:aminoglycoside phosphotransferase (APT) family kinase protein